MFRWPWPSDQLRVIFFQPDRNRFAQFGGERDQLSGFLRADAADGIVFGGVALAAAGVEVVGIVLPFRPHDER